MNDTITADGFTLTDEGVITDLEILPYEEAQDYGEHKTHIINPPANLHIFQEGMEAQDIVDIARATGQEVVALCGFRFIPKRNPDKYDACQLCIDKAGEIMREMWE